MEHEVGREGLSDGGGGGKQEGQVLPGVSKKYQNYKLE